MADREVVFTTSIDTRRFERQMRQLQRDTEGLDRDIRLGVEENRFRSAMNNVRREVDSVAQYTKAAFLGALGSSFVTGLAGNLKKAIVGGINDAISASNTALVLEAITGKDAASQLAFVRQEADRLNSSFKESANLYKQLAGVIQGTGVENDLQDIARGFITVFGAYGLTRGQQANVAYGLSQMVSNDVVALEELRQVLDPIPAGFRIAAQAIGVTTQELKQLASEGKLASDVFVKELARGLEEASEEIALVANALPANIENQMGELNMVFAKVGEQAYNAFGPTYLEGLKIATEASRLFIEVMDELAVAVAAASLALTPFLAGKVAAAFAGITAVIAGWSGVIITVGALAAAGVSVYKAFETYFDLVNSGNDLVKESANAFEISTKELEKQDGVVQKLTRSWRDLINVYSQNRESAMGNISAAGIQAINERSLNKIQAQISGGNLDQASAQSLATLIVEQVRRTMQASQGLDIGTEQGKIYNRQFTQQIEQFNRMLKVLEETYSVTREIAEESKKSNKVTANQPAGLFVTPSGDVKVGKKGGGGNVAFPIAGVSYQQALSKRTGTFYDRRVRNGVPGTHSGEDFAYPTGTGVISPFAGRVHSVYSDRGEFGVRIRSLDNKYEVALNHLDQIFVKQGQFLDMMAQVGTVGGGKGSWGSTGPHLDLKVKNLATGQYMQPGEFFKQGRVGGNVTLAREKAINKAREEALKQEELAQKGTAKLFSSIARSAVEMQEDWEKGIDRGFKMIMEGLTPKIREYKEAVDVMTGIQGAPLLGDTSTNLGGFGTMARFGGVGVSQMMGAAGGNLLGETDISLGNQLASALTEAKESFKELNLEATTFRTELPEINQNMQQLNSSMQSAVGGFFSSAILDINNIGDAFSNMLSNIAASLASFAGQSLTQGLFGGIFGGGGSFLGLPSIFAEGGMVQNFAGGGIVDAMRREGSGAVPIVAHVGEQLLSAKTGDAQLFRLMQRNGQWGKIKSAYQTSGYVPNYEYGGIVGGGGRSMRRSSSYSPSINIYAKDVDSYNKSRSQIAYEQKRLDRTQRRLT